MASRVLTLALFVTCATVAAAAGQGRRPAGPALILDSLTGRDSFEFYCASCHGSGGKGDGPVAPSLKMPPADLTALARRNGGAFPHQRVVSLVTGAEPRLATVHGSSEMPVWGPVFRFLDPSDVRVKLRIENVVSYIETLQIK
jgi:mono/diheme cytochrome c family protein